MKLLTLTINETKKLLKSKATYLLFFITILSPLCAKFGNFTYGAVSQTTLTILSPVKTGAIICSALWAVFTIYEMDLIFRYNTICLLGTVINAFKLNAAKTFSIIISSVLAVFMGAIIYLPYTAYSLDSLFNTKLYFFSCLIIMLPGIIFSILLSSGLYIITRRMDISLLLFGIMFYISLNVSDNYLAAWIQTNIPAYSDCFGNDLAIRTALWNRLVWLLFSSGFFLLGLLGTRQYEKNIFQSFRINSGKIYIPSVAMLLIIASGISFIYEPYYDSSKDITQKMVSDKSSKSSVLVTYLAKKENDNVILKNTKAQISLNPNAAELQGTSLYYLENPQGTSQKIPLYIQPGYVIRSIYVNGKKAVYKITNNITMNSKLIELTLPPDGKSHVKISYGGKVLENRLLEDTLGVSTIGKNYINLGGNSFIPDFSVDKNSNEFSGKVTLPSDLMPIITGKEAKVITKNYIKKTTTWEFNYVGSQMELLAGTYKIKKFRAGGINIDFYYSGAHEKDIIAINAVKVIKDAINYYTALLGKLDYEDMPLKIVDNTVLQMGGGAIGNISNISENTFNPSTFAVSSPTSDGSNGADVLAHEICHQWWGIGVTFPSYGDGWSAEGLTVFTSNKFLEHEYGKEYAKRIGLNTWMKIYGMLKKSFYYRHPKYLSIIPDKFLFNILTNNNSIIMYDKMPLEINKAEQLVGKLKFKKLLGKLYRRYKNGLSFEDFLTNCKLSKEEISVD